MQTEAGTSPPHPSSGSRPPPPTPGEHRSTLQTRGSRVEVWSRAVCTTSGRADVAAGGAGEVKQREGHWGEEVAEGRGQDRWG